MRADRAAAHGGIFAITLKPGVLMIKAKRATEASERGEVGERFEAIIVSSGLAARKRKPHLMGAGAVLVVLGGLGGRFSEALRGVVDVNDLAGTRERLAKLFKKMQEQGLSAGELGGLTGSQFLDLITNIIGRIDDLAKAADGGVSTDTGTITAGGISLPPSVVEGTQTATASSVASLLTDNNAFQARIANATEQAVTHLASIDDKMSTLIDATLSAPSRIDAALENMARQAALNGGTLPVLR